MINKGEEERIDLDRIADGLSEVRPYKSKDVKKPKKQKSPAQEQEQVKGKSAPSEKPRVPDYVDKKDFKKNKVDVDGDIISYSEPSNIKKSSIALLVLAILLFIGVTGYMTVLYGNIPFVTKWRNIWIETAMTTDQHQWLATSFFPKRLIDEVISGRIDNKEISVTDSHYNGIDVYGKESGYILGQTYLVEGEEDPNGNIVYSNNIDEGIVILDVKKSNYRGKLIMIDDPSRVFLATTDKKGTLGKFICDYLEDENAIVGINASGFADPGGHGRGGVVTGQCISRGEYWGTYGSQYSLVGFDEDNRLVVGGMSNWDDYNIRDGMQYRPTLIINGETQMEASSGWGLQPRTVVGQCENGAVLFFVADGRKVGYSLGATMGECADLLLEYGAITAGSCDGGSSSVVGYDGEIINDPSTNMPTGRYLPNAWLVKSKTSEQVDGLR